MSRSNLTANQPNPCTRWFDWGGDDGQVYYYDKSKPEKERNIAAKTPFVFILLDRLSVIKGWHDGSDSAIQSNEVRDTVQEAMVVKAFKGGVIAQGIYANIRDRVKANGGKFTTNLYCAYRNEANELALGCFQIHGAALNAWVEFAKACPVDDKNFKMFWSKAVKIIGFTEGQKGTIKYKMPKFALCEVSEKTEHEANALDMLLQSYLKGYFSRTRVEQVEKTAQVETLAPARQLAAASLVPASNQIPHCQIHPQEELQSGGSCMQCDASDDVPF